MTLVLACMEHQFVAPASGVGGVYSREVFRYTSILDRLSSIFASNYPSESPSGKHAAVLKMS